MCSRQTPDQVWKDLKLRGDQETMGDLLRDTHRCLSTELNQPLRLALEEWRRTQQSYDQGFMARFARCLDWNNKESIKQSSNIFYYYIVLPFLPKESFNNYSERSLFKYFENEGLSAVRCLAGSALGPCILRCLSQVTKRDYRTQVEKEEAVRGFLDYLIPIETIKKKRAEIPNAVSELLLLSIAVKPLSAIILAYAGSEFPYSSAAHDLALSDEEKSEQKNRRP